MKYLTSMRLGRTRSTSDKNQPLVELSLMTTSSPFFGIPFGVRRWRHDGFRSDGIEAIHIQTAEIFGWDNERDVAVKRLSFVFQLKLAFARHCYHGRGTMVMRQVLGFPSLCGDFLLGWRFVEINLHSRLKLTIIEWAIGLIELFACHPTIPFRMGLIY